MIVLGEQEYTLDDEIDCNQTVKHARIDHHDDTEEQRKSAPDKRPESPAGRKNLRQTAYDQIYSDDIIQDPWEDKDYNAEDDGDYSPYPASTHTPHDAANDKSCADKIIDDAREYQDYDADKNKNNT